MLGKGWQIYKDTKKKHDLVFNLYVMRPVAAQLVALLAPTGVTPNQVTLVNLFVFIGATALLVALPTLNGGILAIGVLEASYCPRLRRRHAGASQEDRLEGRPPLRLLHRRAQGSAARRGARHSPLAHRRPRARRSDVAGRLAVFPLAGIAGAVVLASAVSLTNFVRRPELSGRETTVEAHYEANVEKKATSAVGRVAQLVTSFLRFLNHYPSHIWIFAFAGRLDVFFWMYVALNLLYLARGWLGLILRFGRF